MSRIASMTVLLLVAAPSARAQETCAPDTADVSPTQLLRALSLDLRGVVPTTEEYGAVVSSGAIDDTVVEGWLESDEFAARAVRHHAKLLWPSIANVRLVHGRARLQLTNGIWWRRAASRQFGRDLVQCLDEAATFEADGRPRTRIVDGVPREGWVMVRPYWDPSTEVKVCAFDAQAVRMTPTGTDCATRAAYQTPYDPRCGCGPSLAWCETSATSATTLAALAEDVERRIAAVIDGDRPYREIFDSNKAWVNGPIVHYWRNRSQIYQNIRATPLPIDVSALPDLAYTDVDVWREIDLGPEHAGILTSPLYLLRFQTGRGRANRFYDAFLCTPFQPPEGGIPLSDPGAALILDLQTRPGCKYCHAILEPAAAFWGRWTESGAGFLDPARYPITSPSCAACSDDPARCSQECKLWYVTGSYGEEEEPYLGMLRAYEFRREEHVEHVAAGPRMLVDSTFADGRIPACVARRTAGWLLGRDPSAADDEWLDAQEQVFVDEGMSFRSLVRSIVSSETYRRVR